jgi:hypothetical protein
MAGESVRDERRFVRRAWRGQRPRQVVVVRFAHVEVVLPADLNTRDDGGTDLVDRVLVRRLEVLRVDRTGTDRRRGRVGREVVRPASRDHVQRSAGLRVEPDRQVTSHDARVVVLTDRLARWSVVRSAWRVAHGRQGTDPQGDDSRPKYCENALHAGPSKILTVATACLMANGTSGTSNLTFSSSWVMSRAS